MKLFVTGASGYIGHEIALEATKRYEAVHALVRDPSSNLVPRHNCVKLFKGDVTEQDSITAAMKGCAHVIHAAGITRLFAKDPSVFYRVNVDGTRNVLACAQKLNAEKLVFTSSCAVLGRSVRQPLSESDPRIGALENDYEISKYWCEKLIHETHGKGLHTVVVSPSRVYGPGIQTAGNPITEFIGETLRRGWAFIPAKKKVRGNYAYISDVVEGHLLAMQHGASGEKYILGGENISYAQFFSTLRRCADTPILLLSSPTWLLRAWSMCVKTQAFFSRRETHLSPEVIERLLQDREVSSEKAMRHLNYQVTPFEAGMRKTVNYLQQYYA